LWFHTRWVVCEYCWVEYRTHWLTDWLSSKCKWCHCDDVSCSKNSQLVLRNEFPIKRLSDIFHILKVDETMPFCKLFMGWPAYYSSVMACSIYQLETTVICIVCSQHPSVAGVSVREYVFSELKKPDFLRFFEMTFQKNVKSHKQYQVCWMSIEILACKAANSRMLWILIGVYHTQFSVA